MFRSADELAGLVRDGELSSRELVEDSLDRIGALDERINAFTYVDADRALAAADAIEPGDERPYAGVPIAIKDLRAVSGLPMSFGSDLFEGFVPQHDANVVRRFREAGFVIVGLTSLPEFGILNVTQPRRFGATHNPWDETRVPGGSSGGSAAAVASGMVPLAHATDGGGSTRIPAACCGLVGLKPSRGRISAAPEIGESFLVQDGVLTRTVAETAALLDLLAGPELGDASWAPAPSEPFAAAAAREPGRLRIGFTSQPPLDTPIDAGHAQAVRDAADLLASLGHEVEEVTPPWTVPEVFPLFVTAFGAQIASAVIFGGMVAGREPTEADMEPLSWAMYQQDREQVRGGGALMVALAQLQAFARQLVVFADDYDAIMTPTLAEPPVRIGEIDPCGDDAWATFGRSAAFTPFPGLANVTGQPAISLPLFQGEETGLPIGIQLVGRPLDEATLLSLGAQLEAARPWAQRRPEELAAT
jgi:amidase